MMSDPNPNVTRMAQRVRDGLCPVDNGPENRMAIYHGTSDQTPRQARQMTKLFSVEPAAARQTPPIRKERGLIGRKPSFGMVQFMAVPSKASLMTPAEAAALHTHASAEDAYVMWFVTASDPAHPGRAVAWAKVATERAAVRVSLVNWSPTRSRDCASCCLPG